MAHDLITGIDGDVLVADRGYDVNSIISFTQKLGTGICIPPKKNRENQRAYDKALYKWRSLVENAFLKLKCWRGIATRYAKCSDSFLAAIHIKSTLDWIRSF
jgi:transposase